MNILSLKRLIGHYVLMCGDGGGGDGDASAPSGGFSTPSDDGTTAGITATIGELGGNTGTPSDAASTVADDGTTAGINATISEAAAADSAANAAAASWGGEGNTTSTTGGAVGGTNGVSDVSSESLGNAPTSQGNTFTDLFGFQHTEGVPTTMSEDTAQSINNNLTAAVNTLAPGVVNSIVPGAGTVMSIAGMNKGGHAVDPNNPTFNGTTNTSLGDDNTSNIQATQAPVTLSKKDDTPYQSGLINSTSNQYQGYTPPTATVTVPTAGADATMFGDGTGWGSSITKYQIKKS